MYNSSVSRKKSERWVKRSQHSYDDDDDWSDDDYYSDEEEAPPLPPLPNIHQTSSTNFDGSLHLPSDRQQSQSQLNLQLQQQQQQHQQQQHQQQHLEQQQQQLQQQQLQQQQQKEEQKEEQEEEQEEKQEVFVPIRDSIALNDIDSFEVRQATSVPIPSQANPPRSPLLVSTARLSPVPSDSHSTADFKPIPKSETFLELPSQMRKINRRSVFSQGTVPSSQSSISPSSAPSIQSSGVSELTPKHEKVPETDLSFDKPQSSDQVTTSVTSDEQAAIPLDTTVNEPEFDEYMEKITKRAQKLSEEISKPSTPSSGEQSITGLYQTAASSKFGEKQESALPDPEVFKKSSEVSLSPSIDLPTPNLTQVEPAGSHPKVDSSAVHSSNSHQHRQTSQNLESSYYDNDSFDEDIYGYYADSDDNENQEKDDLFKSSLDGTLTTSDEPLPPATKSVAPAVKEVEQIKSPAANIVSDSSTTEKNLTQVSSTESLKDNYGTVQDTRNNPSGSSFQSSEPVSSPVQQSTSNIDPTTTYTESPSLSIEPALATQTFVKPPIPTSYYADSDNESINKADAPTYGRWKPIEPIKSEESKPDEMKSIETETEEVSESVQPKSSQFDLPAGKQDTETPLARPPIPTSSYASDSDTDVTKMATPSYEKLQPSSKLSENSFTDSSSPEVINLQQTNKNLYSSNSQFGSHLSEDDKSSSTPTTQYDLEKDIMKSFENSSYKNNMPVPIIATSHSEHTNAHSEYSLPNSPAVPDPEIAALYRDNSHFLTRPLSQLVDDFPATQPLSPQRSRELSAIRSLDGVLEGDFEEQEKEEGSKDNQLKRTDSSSSWETQLNVSTNSKNHIPEETSESILNPKNPSREPVLERTTSNNSSSNLSPVTSRAESTNTEKSPRYMSMILNDSQIESIPSHGSVMKDRDSDSYDYLNRHGTLATTIINPVGEAANETTSTVVPVNSVPDKLSRPPEFDFRAILTKPRSEDRKKAFDEARHKQAEYNSGLETWLEQVSAQMEPASLRSLGVVTMPTPASHAKPAAPIQKSSTIFSTSSLKPKGSLKPSVLKQGIAGKLSISKVGEKSSGAASRFFAKGRKFMKSEK